MNLRKISSLCALLAGPIIPQAMAGPGDLDSTFGSGSFAAFPASPAMAAIWSGSLHTDNKFVGLGYTKAPTTLKILRWLSTGQLDTTFGTAGVVTPPAQANDLGPLAHQSDGSVLLLSATPQLAGNSDLVVIRFLPNGTLDTTFGSGGMRIINAVANEVETPYQILVRPDNRIVVLGAADKICVAQLTASGALDATFGTGGLSYPTFTEFTYATKMALQPNGGLMVAGGGFQTNTALLFRINPNGTVDATFGNVPQGAVRSTFVSQFKALAIHQDGRIVVGSDYFSNNNTHDFFIGQLSANGAPDIHFSNTGVPGIALFHLASDSIADIAALNNGKLIVTGEAFTSRYIAVTFGVRGDGNLDTNFGTNGLTLNGFDPAGGSEEVNQLIATPDGLAYVLGLGNTLVSAGNIPIIQRLERDPILRPVENWRLTHFGSVLNRGTAADNADADGDGVPNLVEFAFNLDPKNSASNAVPRPQRVGNQFTATFTKPDPTGAKGVILGMQSSTNLASWLNMTNTGNTTQDSYSFPITGNPKAFLRLNVRINPQF